MGAEIFPSDLQPSKGAKGDTGYKLQRLSFSLIMALQKQSMSASLGIQPDCAGETVDLSERGIDRYRGVQRAVSYHECEF